MGLDLFQLDAVYRSDNTLRLFFRYEILFFFSNIDVLYTHAKYPTGNFEEIKTVDFIKIVIIF